MSIPAVTAVLLLVIAVLGFWAWLSLHAGIDGARSTGWILFWLAPLVVLMALAIISFVALAWLLVMLIIAV